MRAYLQQDYPKLDPDELYQLRCSFLHQGTSSTVKYKRIIFAPPNSSVRVHNNEVDDALILDMPMFTRDVISAVRSWQEKVSGTGNYARNIEMVMRWHRGGFGSYIVGGDVLT
ncbi:hypothetical protein G9E11_01790 [Arthrobacter sp. IA7]|uniref:hypothetical protein n=1 Tax=Arthrobacter ipis TaxID=2716202 RepID=UPI0016866DCC|nr:hypothetical protein [Arthrobacter ipis]MBD1541005.1 hypothetical protein [Arthrobacter ipis]